MGTVKQKAVQPTTLIISALTTILIYIAILMLVTVIHIQCDGTRVYISNMSKIHVDCICDTGDHRLLEAIATRGVIELMPMLQLAGNSGKALPDELIISYITSIIDKNIICIIKTTNNINSIVREFKNADLLKITFPLEEGTYPFFSIFLNTDGKIIVVRFLEPLMLAMTAVVAASIALHAATASSVLLRLSKGETYVAEQLHTLFAAILIGIGIAEAIDSPGSFVDVTAAVVELAVAIGALEYATMHAFTIQPGSSSGKVVKLRYKRKLYIKSIVFKLVLIIVIVRMFKLVASHSGPLAGYVYIEGILSSITFLSSIIIIINLINIFNNIFYYRRKKSNVISLDVLVYLPVLAVVNIATLFVLLIIPLTHLKYYLIVSNILLIILILYLIRTSNNYMYLSIENVFVLGCIASALILAVLVYDIPEWGTIITLEQAAHFTPYLLLPRLAATVTIVGGILAVLVERLLDRGAE